MGLALALRCWAFRGLVLRMRMRILVPARARVRVRVRLMEARFVVDVSRRRMVLIRRLEATKVLAQVRTVVGIAGLL